MSGCFLDLSKGYNSLSSSFFYINKAQEFVYFFVFERTNLRNYWFELKNIFVMDNPFIEEGFMMLYRLYNITLRATGAEQRVNRWQKVIIYELIEMPFKKCRGFILPVQIKILLSHYYFFFCDSRNLEQR